MQKITGVGGVIFKARNPQLLMDWYEKHLGIQFQYGFIQFKWADDPAGVQEGSTTVAILKEDSAQFDPGQKPFLINLRVSDLRALVAELREKGVTVAPEIAEYDYGLFSWLIDPEGNKIELWQPVGA